MIEWSRAKFDVALALHACGSATDVAIASAARQRPRAAYVAVPCCIGKLKFSVDGGGSSFHAERTTWTPRFVGALRHMSGCWLLEVPGQRERESKAVRVAWFKLATRIGTTWRSDELKNAFSLGPGLCSCNVEPVQYWRLRSGTGVAPQFKAVCHSTVLRKLTENVPVQRTIRPTPGCWSGSTSARTPCHSHSHSCS